MDVTFPEENPTTRVRHKQKGREPAVEDAKIIALFWARNEDAIAQTDAAYGRRLQLLANRILNNREDAEESVNDTYMEDWEAIPPQKPNYFFAFLAAVCRHLSLDKLDWKPFTAYPFR